LKGLGELKIMAKEKKKGSITIDRELCKGCYLCVSVCPNHLIAVSDKLNQKGYYPAQFSKTNDDNKDGNCTGCATCAIICPDVAIEVYRG
jgi:2-oxoglutarate ferredoxin oxidoreductase subunit delta